MQGAAAWSAVGVGGTRAEVSRFRSWWKFRGAEGLAAQSGLVPHWCAGTKASRLGLVLPFQRRVQERTLKP